MDKPNSQDLETAIDEIEIEVKAKNKNSFFYHPIKKTISTLLSVYIAGIGIAGVHKIMKPHVGTAYAVESAEASVPEVINNKVPGLDYVFDGGVYKWGCSNFPNDRYNKIAKTYLREEDGDLHFLFKDNILNNFLGKYLINDYKCGNLDFVGFNKNSREIGIVTKRGNDYFIGFTTVTDKIHSLFLKYSL